MGQGFLSTGLADTAGDGGDLCAGPGTTGLGKGAQGIQRIGNDEARPAVEAVLADIGYQRCRGAAIECAGDKVMSVEIGAGKGNEQIAAFQRTGVDGNAGC